MSIMFKGGSSMEPKGFKLEEEDDDNASGERLLGQTDSVGEFDPSEQPNNTSTRRCRRNWRICILLGSIPIVLFALYYVWDHTINQRDQPAPNTKKQYMYCGNTVAEARAAGCQFELMSYAWLPEPCVDQELEEEFRSLGFPYFEDIEGTSPVPHEVVVQGDQIVFSTWREHVWHCAFMWKKIVKIANGVKGGGGLSTRMLRMNHTEHCSEMILADDGPPLDEVNTRGTPAFDECVYEEDARPFLDGL
ncbi:hypothetical protein KVR01_001741 [Diaporthe batatas]|uniref:uncharacterized protein n=1 Tax=Diaporthe batatas TaxID=748121 RepID=UPI001D03AAC0|nr:uncharacterized protein KVR01_001741 [Diaporthe batatas]KAG8168992.1 hypothetical protein KVR01_001741 [Diaporthe batatas]